MGLQNRPVRIVLVRHGESQGNVDDAIYETVPDHALTLTDKGIDEASSAGVAIRAHIGDEPVMMYASPYARARQTAEALALGVATDDIRFEPRLREQDWANFQDPADVAAQKKLRDEYGHFYYRFTHGESGSDVYDRVSTFLESMFRSMDAAPETVSGRLGPPMATQNIVIVTHGLTMRLFCMRWFHWSVEYFESLQNPVNGGVVVLVRQGDHRYKLLEPFVQWDRDYVPTARERASWS